VAHSAAAVVFCGTGDRPPDTLATAGGSTLSAEDVAHRDDLGREVYCVVGVPIEAIDLRQALHRIKDAAASPAPFLIATVNVNFLVSSPSHREFRDSVLLGDLCPADGMPIVWIARLLGVPIKHRVAGSDMFEALQTAHATEQPLRVFLFGGADGVAAAAANALNAKQGGLRCVGWIYPGFGTIDEMSTDAIIDKINASGADFLVASLGAQKGQLWLLRNHHRLRIPIRSHFGAVMNFEARTVKRAPHSWRKLGLEWLWRIKEEPHLWRRYCRDGWVLARLVITRAIPLAVLAKYQRLRSRGQGLAIKQTMMGDSVSLALSGFATEQHVAKAAAAFRSAVADAKNIVIELTDTSFIDCRFFGLLLMLRKQLEGSGRSLKFSGISPRLARLFRLNGIGFLLPS
jgi:N-acetylglucosaminyldiphosphoundecaprenol N-acetyl-beta-D-mannosaminyltransferase